MTRPSLMNLAMEYFTRRGYEVRKDQGQEDLRRSPAFDLVVSKRKEAHAVRVKEWNRTIGVNMVISLDKASRAAGFQSPILVAEIFSEHAKAYANRRGIILMTRSEMIRSLR